VWTIEVPLGGTELSVQFNGGRPQTVAVYQVIGVALVAGLLGWLLLALLEWLTPISRAAWTGIALLILAASLVLPLTAATTTAAAVSLITLHLVVGGLVIPGMARTAQPPR
jgi:hypothetical protein